MKSAYIRLSGCTVAGGIMTVAFPPVSIAILALPAMLYLFWSIGKAETKKQAFAAGWLFGFTFYTTSLAWISNALRIDAQFENLIVFPLIGLPAYLSLCTGAAALIAWRYRQSLIHQWLYFALSWAVLEYLRTHYSIPFPWQLVGYVWDANLTVLQLSSVIGIFGMSLFTVLLLTSPVLLLKKKLRFVPVIMMLLLIAAYGYGYHRQQTVLEAREPATVLRLVQPSIPQTLKRDAKAYDQTLHDLVNLSTAEAEQPIQAIIWPETASPYPLDMMHDLRHELAKILLPNSYLITGMNRYVAPDAGHESGRAYNSLIVIDDKGLIADVYDKHWLVPFGEYVPLSWIVNVAAVATSSDFNRGTGARTIKSSYLPDFSPGICYESMYAGDVVDREHRPSWLLNITNDAWYGDSFGPPQHAAYARVRSIEEGMPMVRVANNGITYVTDAFGRYKIQTKLNERRYLDVHLPPALPTPTLYGRYGNMVFLVLCIVLYSLGLVCRRLQRDRN